MTRRNSAFEIELVDETLRVRNKDRVLTIVNAARDQDDEDVDFLVALDEIESWDPPHDGTQFELEELQKILDAIEKFSERVGLDLAFE